MLGHVGEALRRVAAVDGLHERMDSRRGAPIEVVSIIAPKWRSARAGKFLSSGLIWLASSFDRFVRSIGTAGSVFE